MTDKMQEFIKTWNNYRSHIIHVLLSANKRPALNGLRPVVMGHDLSDSCLWLSESKTCLMCLQKLFQVFKNSVLLSFITCPGEFQPQFYVKHKFEALKELELEKFYIFRTKERLCNFNLVTNYGYDYNWIWNIIKHGKHISDRHWTL